MNHSSTEPSNLTRLLVGEKEIAQAIGMSLAFVRKDRRTRKLIPFTRFGDAIRYDPIRVREAFLQREEGGEPPPTQRRQRKSKAGAA
jgi:hypothetical protein